MGIWAESDVVEIDTNADRVLFSPKSSKSKKYSENMVSFEKETEILHTFSLKIKEISDKECHLPTKNEKLFLPDQSETRIHQSNQVHFNVLRDGINGQANSRAIKHYDSPRLKRTKIGKKGGVHI